MKTKFKIGQKVYDSVFFENLEGKVVDIRESLDKTILVVDFNGLQFKYTKEGILLLYAANIDNRKTLATKPYVLEGFTQETVVDWSKYFNTWGIFYDDEEDFENTNRVGRLHDYNGDSIYPFKSYEDESYKNFKPLTEEQIKILNL